MRTKNLVSMLDGSVRRFGSRPLFGTCRDGAWTWITYADFGDRVAALRAALHELGVVAGDRVAVISANRLEWAVGCYATMGLDAVYVPMYENQLEREQRHILADSNARVCLVANVALAARVEAMATALPNLAHVVVFDAPESDARAYTRLMAAGRRAPTPSLAAQPDDLAELVYTSGTTGTPKGVRLTHANVLSNVEAVSSVLAVSEDDRSLGFLPWAHVFGGDELHGIIFNGASLAICESTDLLTQELPEVRPTLLFAVPRVWNRLYQSVQQGMAGRSAVVRAIFKTGLRAQRHEIDGAPLSLAESIALPLAKKLIFAKIRDHFGGRLRFVVSGAAALSKDVAEFIDDLGIVLLEAYGMTESSACATINRAGDRRIGSVGKPIPGVLVAIDTSVAGASPGEGEIVIYGHGVTPGYEKLPDATREAIAPDGGLRSGDLGRIDSDGFLYVTGRIKEIYKLENGKYVAPSPIEETLTLSPYIDQAFVHGADALHNVALIVANTTNLRAWATAHEIDATSDTAIAQRPEVRALLAQEIDAHNRDLKGYERVCDFAIVEEPFTTDNGMLTPTFKVRRRKVLERYGETIRALHARDVAPRAQTRSKTTTPS